MGVPVLVIGESGSGKTASLRNFDAGEVGIFNVAGKRLPFKKKLPTVNTSSYEEIKKGLGNSPRKCFVIDDSQYLMAFEQIAKAKEQGYQKYTDMGLHFNDLIQYVVKCLPDDKIVYFLHHPDVDQMTGAVRAKTVGKMIDNWLTLEGLFSIVLYCWTDGRQHKFITQSDGHTTAKSPMDMFEAEMDNDLKLVDSKIRMYYEMEEVKE